MNRTEALAYLNNEVAAIAAKTGVTSDDTATGYKEVLDSAFRLLGVTKADLATATLDDETDETLKVVVKYFAYERFMIILSANNDIRLPGLEVPKSQLFRQVKQLFDKAEEQLRLLGFLVGGGEGSFTTGYVWLDWLNAG